MEVLYGPQYSIKNSSVVAIGKFDGLHIGHMKIIDTVLAESRNEGLLSVIYTFDEHPKKVLGEKGFNVLMSNEEKIKEIEKFGIDVLVFEKFDEEYANMLPEKFVKDILIDKLKTKKLVMGSNSTFGKDGAGTIKHMNILADKYGFEVIEVELIYRENQIISSTSIRNSLKGEHV
jgi:riboflavin kinase/FMN adenylyltransferase